MKKPTALKLNGKPLDLNTPRPAITKIVEFLDKLPDDELKTCREVERLTTLGSDSVWKFAHLSGLSHYTHREGKNLYYGNPRAIVALKQFLAEQEK